MDKAIQKLGKSNNEIIKKIITKVCPFYYLKEFYKNNIDEVNWDGRKACFTLSFDCDYTKDIKSLPLVLDILSTYSFRASFACVGKLIEKYPKEHMRIINEGHEIINHTYTHPDSEELNPSQKFNELTMEQQKYEIEKCDEVCKKVLRYTPIGFRIPHFGRLYSENIYPILKEINYKYSSSTIATKTPNFGLPFEKGGIIEFPLSGCPRHPFGVFDTWHSLERGEGKHKKEKEFYELFKELIDIGGSNNSYINIYLDPQDIVSLEEFKEMLDYIENQKKTIWIATYKNIFEKYIQGEKIYKVD